MAYLHYLIGNLVPLLNSSLRKSCLTTGRHVLPETSTAWWKPLELYRIIRHIPVFLIFMGTEPKSLAQASNSEVGEGKKAHVAE